MSHDLYAAFTDAKPARAAPPEELVDDDDWGEFVVAGTVKAGHDGLSESAGPDARERQTSDVRSPAASSVDAASVDAVKWHRETKDVGKHPFAGHMDILFEPDGEYDAGADDLDNLATNPEAAVAYSKRIIESQHSRSTQRHDLPQKVPVRSIQRNPNLLFDVEDLSDSQSEDNDQSWRSSDNANTTSTSELTATQHAPNKVDTNLLEFGHAAGAGKKAGSSADIIKTSELTSRTFDPKSSTSASDTLHNVDDNPWQDFEAVEPAAISDAGKVKHLTHDRNQSFSDADWGDFNESDSVVQSTPQDSVHVQPHEALARAGPVSAIQTLPPTNIPPPSVLLSVFPSLFSSAQEDLFTPLSKLSSAQKHQLLEHQAAQKIIRRHLSHAVVLAHIIAGRKLRWRRDQILSQSMRIGMAGTSAKGMKLAGVDKTEVAKEDREVLDAVKTWKAQVGRLRGTIASVPQSVKLPQIPEISEYMPVKALKAVEGGMVAPHACVLCGLRREERVVRIDVDVDDSFDEWWLNGMHASCKTWWEENRKKLRLR